MSFGLRGFEWPLLPVLHEIFAEAANGSSPPFPAKKTRGRRPHAPATQFDRAVSSAAPVGRTTPVELYCTCYPQPSPGAGFRGRRAKALCSKPVLKGKTCQTSSQSIKDKPMCRKRKGSVAKGRTVRRFTKALSQMAKLCVVSQ